MGVVRANFIGVKTSDLNFEAGGKLTGKLSPWEKMINLPLLQSTLTAEENWFSRDVGARVVDLSKHNGVVNWPILLDGVDGVIYRLGYGSVMDERFKSVCLSGFTSKSADHKYKAVYHYMNTGVTVQAQVDLVLNTIDLLDGQVHAFWEDIEGAYNEMTSSAFYSNPLRIMREVRREFPEISVGFYTNGAGWHALGRPRDWLEEFLFWYAWYPYQSTRYPGLQDEMKLEDIYLWQYSADGNKRGGEFGVQSRDIDVNVTRDSAEEFLSEYGIEVEEEEDVSELKDLKLRLTNEIELQEAAVDEAHETIEDTLITLRSQHKNHRDIMISLLDEITECAGEPDPEPLYQKSVSVNTLNVRNGPGVNYSKVGELTLNDIIDVWEERYADGYTWGRISATEDIWCALDFTQ